MPGKITCTIAVFIMLVCMSHFQAATLTFNELIDDYFKTSLQNVSGQLEALKQSCSKKTTLKNLQGQFRSCRAAYKKLAVLSEYFNVYETKFLNGPALPRAEDGTPDVIIPPQGFQAIEEILFGEPGANYHEEVNELIGKMQTVILKMEKEPGRHLKFSPELVWDALRSSSLRIATLGITGFDSPVALHSLPEARQTLKGLTEILLLAKPLLFEKDPKAVDTIFAAIHRADVYLSKQKNFNGFNRLDFLTSYIDPVYALLVKFRKMAGIGHPSGRNPINLDKESIFDRALFDINFFSPGEEYRITDNRVALGKKLFSDPILSGVSGRSCASCHLPAKAFADGLAQSLAIDNKTHLRRNTPTLWNSALQTRQFFDTRADILENQLKEVVHNNEEMEGSLAVAASELKKSAAYRQLFEEAYAAEKEPVNAYNIANAISSYIRTLVALDSRFDQYMRGDRSKLTASEKNGFNLFTGKAKCATCHFVPLFNGLVPPEFTETETEVLGVPATKEKNPAVLDADLGKFELTQSVIHKSAFKTPGLRNIAQTSPYMHNGVFNTLEEVMEFYNEGGGAGLDIAPENQTLPQDKLNLSKKEIADIIAFMNSLTDPSIVTYK